MVTVKNVSQSTEHIRSMSQTACALIITVKIKLLSELTEHTIADEIEAPCEVLRKEFQ